MDYTSSERKAGRQAFKQLDRKGCPVKKTNGPDAGGYAQYGGLFCISAEEGISPLWLEYYSVDPTWEQGTYSNELNKVLEKKGLYLEWANPAVGVIYVA